MSLIRKYKPRAGGKKFQARHMAVPLLDSRGNSPSVTSEMANKAEKWKDNIAGKFYVDQQCIDCDLCRETAPAFFKRHEEGGYSFVHTQPTTEDDVQLCMEALEGCPVEAIGNDGDE